MSSPESTSTSKALLYFHYEPINGAPEAFLVVFAIITALFIHRIIKSQSGKWLYILPGTALAEMIGYGFRTACVFETTLGMYIGMNFLLLVAPNALALVNYKTLGNVIAAKTPTFTSTDMEGQHGVIKDPFWLRPKFVTWFFFWSDIFAFFMQGSGGGLQATASSQKLGQVITLIGLCVQLFFFAAFTAIAIYVYRSHHYDYQLLAMNTHHNPKKRVMTCLFVTIVLLYVRSIYRVAEYATGYDGPIATAEWAFYVFDSAVIVTCFLVYYIWFVGDHLPVPSHVSARDSSQSNVHLSVFNKD
ncbi:hypothetical protein [Absidia glauca]|uniref:RTA1 like protein n=1 Tax=Absidia glauca TaxID=4829 RepID=A0A163KPJ9_ABSGL|nr:hypothetical protein [Absidia glauca]